jgi:hypothetical protein
MSSVYKSNNHFTFEQNTLLVSSNQGSDPELAKKVEVAALEIIQTVERKDAFAPFIKDNRVNLQARDSNGRTLLFLAVIHSYGSLVS